MQKMHKKREIPKNVKSFRSFHQKAESLFYPGNRFWIIKRIYKPLPFSYPCESLSQKTIVLTKKIKIHFPVLDCTFCQSSSHAECWKLKLVQDTISPWIIPHNCIKVFLSDYGYIRTGASVQWLYWDALISTVLIYFFPKGVMLMNA